MGCFQFLSIVNRVMVDLCMHALQWMYFLGLYLDVEMLGSQLLHHTVPPTAQQPREAVLAINPFHRGGH